MREAWATPSQLRGEAVVRFILSEDEQTAQVSKEVETYNDIVFLHVRTLRTSFLLDTFKPAMLLVKETQVHFAIKTCNMEMKLAAVR